MPSCAAKGCTNTFAKGFKLYRLPKDPERRAAWVAKIARDDWKPCSSSLLCNIHFEESEFEQRRADGLRKLKPNAIPTLFPPPCTFKNVKKKAKRKMTASGSLLKECSTQQEEVENGLSSLDCISISPAQIDQLYMKSCVVLNKPGDETMKKQLQRKGKFKIHNQKPVRNHPLRALSKRRRRRRRPSGTIETENSTTVEENDPDLEMGTVGLDVFLSTLRLSSFPLGWCWPNREQPSFTYLHRCRGERYQQWTVTRQVDLSDDTTYSLLVHGRPVRPSRFPSDWPRSVDSSEALYNLLECVSEVKVCPGNPEEEFGRLAADIPEDALNAWDPHGTTVRASGCHLLSPEWYQCAPCQELRETMHRILDGTFVGNCALLENQRSKVRRKEGDPEALPFTVTTTNDSEIVFADDGTNSKERDADSLTDLLPRILTHAVRNMTPEELKEPLVIRKVVQIAGVKKNEKTFLIKDIDVMLEKPGYAINS